MTTFSTNPYFIIFQRFECYTTPIVKELFYNNKINSKSVVTYITMAVTNISNNIIKQYYRKYCFIMLFESLPQSRRKSLFAPGHHFLENLFP